MKKLGRISQRVIIVGLAAVLAIIALLLGNGLRQRTNMDAGNTTPPAGPSSPAVTTAPPTTAPTAPATTAPTAPPTTVTTAPPPTEPENTNIVVITQNWRPFIEDATEFGEVDVTELSYYHLVKCELEGTRAVYGGMASSLYRSILFMPEVLEDDLQNATVTYDVRVNYGELCHYDDRYIEDGQHSVYTAGQYFHWMGHDLWYMHLDGLTYAEVLEKVGGVWVDIVVMVDDNIVGCAVYQIVPYQHFGLTAQYVCSEYYPQVNGRYQPITEEFVQKRLEACHQG